MRAQLASPFEKRLVIFVLSTFLFSSGCQPDDAGSANLVTNDFGTGEGCSNNAWDEVYSGILPTTTSLEKGSLSYLMASAEFAKQQIRIRGKEMWDRCPDDERRYDWLVATTHLDPEWPVDIESWATGEEWPRQTPADIEWEYHYEWTAEFGKLKAEFKNSSSASRQKLRYLELGELARAIRLAVFETSIGMRVESKTLVTRVFNFLETYTSKENSLDRDPYEWSIVHMVDQLVTKADALELSSETRVDFVEYLSESVLGRLERWDISEERLKNFAQGRRVEHAIEISDSNTANPWLGFPGHFYHGRPVPVVADQIHDSTSTMVFLFKREITYRQYREFGLRLLDGRSKSFDDIRWWFQHTNTRPPIYIEEIADLLSPNGTEFSILPTLSTHEATVQSWTDKYQEIRGWIFEESSTDDEYRMQIARRELKDSLKQNLADQVFDREAGMNLLDSIHDIYTNSAVPRQNSVLSDVRTFVSFVVRKYGDIGLSRQDVWDFLKSVQHFTDDNFLSTVAAGWRNLYSADRAIAPNLKLESMDHGLFDLQDLRGKIVLLDFWSTNCSSCIAAFPRLRDIEREYVEEGFAVVSIGLDAARKEKIVRRIKSEMDLTWPTLIADDDMLKVRQNFGVFAVPDYVLLDREGRAVADTYQIDMGRNLGAILDEMLAAEAEEQETAAVH